MRDESGPRIKFDLNYLGAWTCPEEFWSLMAGAIEVFVRLGCLPIMRDGTYAGNIGLKTGDGIIVSRSSRGRGASSAENFVLVTDFDVQSWKVSYRSPTPDIAPTSDTPLYWSGLVDLPSKQIWGEAPGVAVHGHGWCTERDARILKAPITSGLTEFSTREDSRAMEALFRNHPYPEQKCYIRRGHGFFAVGKDFRELQETLVSLIS